eukprot:1764909-Pleurochrysis_carterae.AAC.2
MRRERLREHLSGVVFTRLLQLSSGKLVRMPALKLLGSSGCINVPALAIFGLHGVFPVAVHEPVCRWVDVADQKRAVVVQRMRFASVVAREFVLLRIVGETDAGWPRIRAVAHVIVVVRTIGEPSL